MAAMVRWVRVLFCRYLPTLAFTRRHVLRVYAARTGVHTALFFYCCLHAPLRAHCTKTNAALHGALWVHCVVIGGVQ